VGVALQDFLPKRYSRYIGLSWQWQATGDGNSVDRRGRISAATRRSHPLAGNLPDTLEFEEEIYYNLYGDTSAIRILNASREPAAGGIPGTSLAPVMWTKTTGNGKVFASIIGHYTYTHNDPVFRLLLLRGLAWASGRPFDRFRGLVFQGATVVNDIPLRAGPGQARGFQAGIHALGLEPFPLTGFRADGRILSDRP
jgi:hypothetical protein